MTKNRTYRPCRPQAAQTPAESACVYPRRSVRYAETFFQEDASGWQTFKYGKLGEVIENIRTFALPFESRTYTFKMKNTSMNRHQPYPPSLPQTAQIPAESACFYPRRYVRYAEMFTSDTRRFPCGDADGPMRPAPFRRTHRRPWPQSATPVRRNLDQYPRFAGTHTFSAKEHDPETGYSYFGARYYNSDLSIWLSVDPMASKYPSLSPYVYCANNPVRLVDPNGEEINPIFNKAGVYVGKTIDEADDNRSAIIMDNYSKEKYPNGITVGQATSKKAGGIFLNEYKEGINISDQEWGEAVKEGGERMFPFVENHSNETIYFKPERSIGEGDNRVENDGAYPLGAGKDLYMPVDGIATGYYKNRIVKAKTGTTITVGRGGTVFSGWTKATRIAPIYGWIYRDAIPSDDKTWDNLFGKACQIGRLCGGRGYVGNVVTPPIIKLCYWLKGKIE